MQNSLSRYIETCVFILSIVCLNGVARAQSLSATLLTPFIEACEPVTLEIELGDTPGLSTTAADRNKAKFRIELLNDSGEVYSGRLIVRPFSSIEDRAGHYTAIGIALMAAPNRHGDKFTHFDRPGKYNVIVRSLTHDVHASVGTLQILAPDEELAAAAKVFKENFSAIVAYLIGSRSSVEATEALDRLAVGHPRTIYGRYAKLCVGLASFEHVFKRENNRGGASVWAPVAELLRGALESVEFTNPLWDDAMLAMAKAYAFSGEVDSAKQTVERLRAESRRPQVRMVGAQFLDELQKFKTRASAEEK